MVSQQWCVQLSTCISSLQPEMSAFRRLVTYNKGLFQTYGAPEEVSTDGDPLFDSIAFQEFLRMWCVKHRLSSVTYPQSNGQAKLAVKTTKRIVKGNTSPQGSLNNDNVAQAILQDRSTPTPTPLPTLWLHSFTASPLQATPGMGSGGAMPWKNSPPPQCKKIVERYNKYIHKFLPLQTGDTVAIQSPLNQRWNKTGKIITPLPDHQYGIRVDGSGRITLRNSCFLRKCDLKPAPTPIPSETVGPITPSSNTPLLHPYPPTSLYNGTCTAIETPQTNHIYITMPSIVKNSLSSTQAISTQLTGPKRRVLPSYNLAYSWVKGDVEITTLMCRINNKNSTYRFYSPSWQIKSKMGDNPVLNL